MAGRDVFSFGKREEDTRRIASEELLHYYYYYKENTAECSSITVAYALQHIHVRFTWCLDLKRYKTNPFSSTPEQSGAQSCVKHGFGFV